ncbi:hypothetical protein BDF14DRAFT_270577 [Spinellus fusiger]|nr:hypothetical protein BDF14DRAFT_270577 [Spinellus fusiger]
MCPALFVFLYLIMASTSALSSMQADISKKLIMSESLKTPSPPPTQDTRLPTTCSPEKTHHQNRVTHNKQSPESHPASVILQDHARERTAIQSTARLLRWKTPHDIQ